VAMKILNKKMRIISGAGVMLFIGLLLGKIVSRKKQDISVPLDKDFDFVKIKDDENILCKADFELAEELQKIKEEIISLWEHIEALSNSEKSREKSLWHM
jgi:hypothetical protein